MRKKNDTVKRIVFVVCIILTVAWMMVIFGFSSNDAQESTAQSHTVTEIIIRIFNRDFDNMTQVEQEAMVSEFDGIVRKIAHFIAYAVLGFLMYFSLSLVPFVHHTNIYKPIILSLPLSILFAATDEYHQTFVSGRAGRFSDILIDSCGALCGTLFALAVMSIAIRMMMDSKNKRGL